MDDIEVSIIMPCLNEEESIATCIKSAQEVLQENGWEGEIIVSDNGSIDKSVEISQSLGTRVVHESQKGYGSAYLKGFSEAKGRYLVMADSDGTYNFNDMAKFLRPLQNGEADFVIGNRFGHGGIKKGAMPRLHQYIGNPVLTWILNRLFGANVTDAHCGMRAFTKESWNRMNLRATGMEFASEMLIEATNKGLTIKEVPTSYSPRKGQPKLRSFRDGWRHIKFMFLYKIGRH